VNPALAGVALAVVVGGLVAASARHARTAVLGLLVVLVAAPFVADPLPAMAPLLARIVGAVLGGYVLWVAARGPWTRTGGSPVGWPTDAFLAAAAAVVGFGSHGLGAPTTGPAAASAAGFALAALAVLPVVTGRDILRVGIGLALLLTGALLVRVGLGGTPDAVEQSFNLVPTLTAEENVALAAEYAGTSGSAARVAARASLASVGLAERAGHRPMELSGGEQQRVAIARALVNDPKLILGDEPTGNLDSSRAAEVLGLLRRFNRERRQTVLIVTHDQEVGAACDRIIRMRDGRIIADERVADVQVAA